MHPLGEVMYVETGSGTVVTTGSSASVVRVSGTVAASIWIVSLVALCSEQLVRVLLLLVCLVLRLNPLVELKLIVLGGFVADAALGESYNLN
jgi:hypothetical protein